LVARTSNERAFLKEQIERSTFVRSRAREEQVIRTQLQKKREYVHLSRGHTDCLKNAGNPIIDVAADPILLIYGTPHVGEAAHL